MNDLVDCGKTAEPISPQQTDGPISTQGPIRGLEFHRCSLSGANVEYGPNARFLKLGLYRR